MASRLGEANVAMTDEVSITQSISSSTTRYATPWKSARSPFSRRRRLLDSLLCSDKSVVKLTLCRDFVCALDLRAVSPGNDAPPGGKPQIAAEVDSLTIQDVCIFRHYSLFASSFSAEASRTHWHTMWVACSNSSSVGQEGAIRRFLSLGSHP